MSENLSNLYQEIILDHGKHPHNIGVMDDATHKAMGNNPLCGDKITLFLKIDKNDVINDIKFMGSGCAISIASASLMTDHLKGKNISEARQVFKLFHDLLVAAEMDDNIEHQKILGKLMALAGVREFPVRVKCATLPWHSFDAAIVSQENIVSTE